jgi:hypothetical protein
VLFASSVLSSSVLSSSALLARAVLFERSASFGFWVA